MVIFSGSRLNYSNFEAVSYKHVTYIKKRALFTKINLLMFQKISKYPQKLMSLNNKVEVCAN